MSIVSETIVLDEEDSNGESRQQSIFILLISDVNRPVIVSSDEQIKLVPPTVVQTRNLRPTVR